MTLLGCFLLLLVAFSTPSSSLDNGLARVPPMGWNSWNKFHCNINDKVMFAAARQLVNLGLADVGYNYINMDDCWMAPNRTDNGRYQANPETFPSGMKAVGDYIHSLGLKYGIYTSAGTLTCQRLPASLGREEEDAQTFASWGVDYLKYDNCYNEGILGIKRYTKMRDALAKTGRPILYSLCQWGQEDSWRWAGAVGNVWRTTGDISPNWNSIKNNFLESQQVAAYTGPGAWADPDILEVGNGDLTLDEQKSHFAMWALAKAPLLLGMDLEQVTDDVLAIVKNENLVAVNQDPLAKQALCYLGCNGTEIPSSNWSAYATTVTGGDTVMMIVNWSDDDLEGLTISAQNVGVLPAENEAATVTDLWTSQLVGTFDFKSLLSFEIPPMAPHGNVVYRFSLYEEEEEELVVE